MPDQQTATPANADPLGQSLTVIGKITDEPATFIDQGAKALKLANGRLTILAATNAFRGFEGTSPTLIQPIRNRFGTLRGMVTSAAWRHVFTVHVGFARSLEGATKLAGYLAWANYIAGWGEEIDAVARSSEPWDVKAQKLCFYPTTALAKMVIGTAHGLTDLTIYGAQAACSLGGALHIGGMPSVSQCANYADVARAAVGVAFKKEEDFFSPENIRAGIIDGGGAALAAAWEAYDTSKSYVTHVLK